MTAAVPQQNARNSRINKKTGGKKQTEDGARFEAGRLKPEFQPLSLAGRNHDSHHAVVDGEDFGFLPVDKGAPSVVVRDAEIKQTGGIAAGNGREAGRSGGEIRAGGPAVFLRRLLPGHCLPFPGAGEHHALQSGGGFAVQPTGPDHGFDGFVVGGRVPGRGGGGGGVVDEIIPVDISHGNIRLTGIEEPASLRAFKDIAGAGGSRRFGQIFLHTEKGVDSLGVEKALRIGRGGDIVADAPPERRCGGGLKAVEGPYAGTVKHHGEIVQPGIGGGSEGIGGPRRGHIVRPGSDIDRLLPQRDVFFPADNALSHREVGGVVDRADGRRHADRPDSAPQGILFDEQKQRDAVYQNQE